MKRIPFTPILAAGLLILPSLAFAADPGATFVPLTSIPGITDLTSAPSFPALLNGLYRILIGVAAFLAIARFIYAGYTIMTDSGSVTKNKKAKEIIQNTVIGLVLVLSPVIVFGIINPKVLDLSLDFSSLQSSSDTSGGGYTSKSDTSNQLWLDNSSNRTTAQTRCTTDGGTATFVCVPKDGKTKGRVVPITEGCDTATEVGSTVCTGKAGSVATTATSCKDYTDFSAIITTSGCNGAAEFKKVDASCCVGAAKGAICCAKSK